MLLPQTPRIISRRQFLRGTATAVAGALVLPPVVEIFLPNKQPGGLVFAGEGGVATPIAQLVIAGQDCLSYTCSIMPGMPPNALGFDYQRSYQEALNRQRELEAGLKAMQEHIARLRDGYQLEMPPDLWED